MHELKVWTHKHTNSTNSTNSTFHRAIQGDNIMLGNPVLLKGLQYSAHLNNHSKCHTLPPGLETRLPWSSPEMIRQV